MDVTSVANQALYLRDQTSNAQLGISAMKQAADSQNQVATMLAKNAATITPPQQSEEGGFSTYA